MSATGVSSPTRSISKPIRCRCARPSPIRSCALVDGAFVTVKVEQGAPQQRLIIPRSALQLDQIGVYVLIVDNDKKVQVRRVTTGEAVNTDIAIASGLQAGDKVIIDGIQKVRPGQVVNATDVGGAAGAAK